MPKTGDTVTFEVKFYNTGGTPLTGATVTVNLYSPDHTLKVSGGSATERTAGRYSYDYAVDSAGFWRADFSTTNETADLNNLTDRIWVDDPVVVGLKYDTTQFQGLIDALTGA